MGARSIGRVLKVKVYVTSLGCKLNQSEVENFARELNAAGHQVVSDPGDSDTIIVNTCAVTQTASRKSCQLARRLHRANTNARLVLTGCFAEISPDKAAELPGVQKVVGNTGKDRILELLGLSTCHTSASQLGRNSPTLLRTRALVKIQDGCDNECTYCIVRLARGPQHSRDKREIIAEIHDCARAGYKEIVLTGVHIGAYGRDQRQTAKTDLWDLVNTILRETPVPRLRLSSIEPWDISPEHLALWQNGRLCRHLHLPLQSGSDTVLSRMKRRYRTCEFADVVEAARRMVPQMAITTDLIVGFPGETEREFEESLRFVEAMQFSKVHIFPYSARPGTQAAEFPGQVSSEVKPRPSPIGSCPSGRTSFLGEIRWADGRSLVGNQTEHSRVVGIDRSLCARDSTKCIRATQPDYTRAHCRTHVWRAQG